MFRGPMSASKGSVSAVEVKRLMVLLKEKKKNMKCVSSIEPSEGFGDMRHPHEHFLVVLLNGGFPSISEICLKTVPRVPTFHCPKSTHYFSPRNDVCECHVDK